MRRQPTKPAHPTPRGRPAPLDAALGMAIAAHQDGRHTEAERRYRALLAAAPRHPDALHYLGVLLHQQGQSEAALGLIEQALALAPGYVDARNNLGNVQKELGLHGPAADSYRAVLAARPGFAPALNNLGVVLKAAGRASDAVDAYRRCLAIAPEFAECWGNLGNALRAQALPQEAMSAYFRAIELAPQTSDAYQNLGQALVSSGRTGEALEVYRRWREQQPGNPAIEHMIAAVAGGEAPGRASDGYVQTTFDRFAGTFDEVLKGLDYRAPTLCGDMVATFAGPPAAALDILDAGCGTGLCGPILLPWANTLDGVDLSAGMLKKAALRKCYGRLEEAELTAWLAGQSAAYDMLVSADTLCYFGDLEMLLDAAAGALRTEGLLVFTVESFNGEAPFHLNPHGRYSHSETYVRQVLAQAGLAVLEVRQAVLRSELGKPVDGLVVAARRRA